MAELGKPLKINLNCHKNSWLGKNRLGSVNLHIFWPYISISVHLSYTPVKSTRVTGDSMHLNDFE